MKHKKVAAALSAAVAGASVLAGIRYAVGKRKPKAEPETAIQEEGLTEGKLRECLLCLFRLYEDSEFDDSAEFLGDGGDPGEYEAENYSSQLFPYIKRNMKDVMMMEGDDGTGKEPFAITTEEQFKTFLEKTVMSDHACRILDELTAQNAPTAPAQGAETAAQGNTPPTARTAHTAREGGTGGDADGGEAQG